MNGQIHNNGMMKIVFMGTPEFAVASLRALMNEGFNIVGVVTAPDKPAGRGMHLQQSAVKKYAVENELKILQPEKLKDQLFLQELKSLNAQLQIVVAFRMLPEVVWNMPPMGTINVHGSLLPQYRGAAPINWAIINGEKETGVTTFKLKHEIDTGDILLQKKISIGENETAGELHDKMKETGAQLLVQTVNGLMNDSLKEIPQAVMGNGQLAIDNEQSAKGDEQSLQAVRNDGVGNPTSIEATDNRAANSPFTIHHSPLHHAPKIFTETCKINWNKPVDEVHNLIRGLSPFPGAFTFLHNKMLKIYQSEKTDSLPKIAAGEMESDGKIFLQFACTNGYIIVKELQLEGKKRMMVEDFLRGYKFPPNIITEKI